MHNLDRTTAEFEFEDALQEFEYENDGEYEADQEYEHEYEDEYEDNEWEAEYESDEFESPFSEEEEMELAGELLDVNNEAELDQFLGKIFKKIGRRVKKIGRRLVPKVFRGLETVCPPQRAIRRIFRRHAAAIFAAIGQDYSLKNEPCLTPKPTPSRLAGGGGQTVY
ncbi:MAG: hypothetical protein IPH12_00020 [Saprospirales bacterium]|jgi:hypothetical protein|nr:hypothetical protein [Saprospirales bacterium]